MPSVIYGVSAGVSDLATVASTTQLRDVMVSEDFGEFATVLYTAC
jgi:hypothetical protein